MGSLVSNGGDCFVADGTATIFVEEGTDLIEIRAAVEGAIKQAMDSGVLDNVEGSVVRVTFRDDTTTSQIPEEPKPLVPPSSSSSSSDSDMNLLWVWVVGGIVLGSVFMCVAYKVLTRASRRVRRRERVCSPGSDALLVCTDNTFDLVNEQTTPLPPRPRPPKKVKRRVTRLDVIAEEDEEEEELEMQLETAILS